MVVRFYAEGMILSCKDTPSGGVKLEIEVAEISKENIKELKRSSQRPWAGMRMTTYEPGSEYLP